MKSKKLEMLTKEQSLLLTRILTMMDLPEKTAKGMVHAILEAFLWEIGKQTIIKKSKKYAGTKSRKTSR